jgi:bla regulator protein blaR1
LKDNQRMTNRATRNRGRLLLNVVLALTVADPLSIGQANAAAPQAQGAAAQLPVFEVSTVKPNKSGDGGTRIMFTPDGVSYTGIPVQMLLRDAFGVEDDRILGAPGWVTTDRFDIEAKVDASDAPKLKDLKFEQRRQMLVPLLVDRFNLKFHDEIKELPTYALVIAKSGTKLHEAKPGDTYPNGMKGPDGQAHAGAMMMGRGKITGQGVSIAMLLGALLRQGIDRTVVDRTGLTGNYDFTLEWTPDNAPPAMTGGSEGGRPVNSAPSQSDAGPSIYTALEEQLGLKLESQKGPVDVIVIDHVEQPSPN